MNGTDTLSMSLYDYQAAVYHWSEAHKGEDEAGSLPSPDDVDAVFLQMADCGMGRIN